MLSHTCRSWAQHFLLHRLRLSYLNLSTPPPRAPDTFKSTPVSRRSWIEAWDPCCTAAFPRDWIWNDTTSMRCTPHQSRSWSMMKVNVYPECQILWNFITSLMHSKSVCKHIIMAGFICLSMPGSGTSWRCCQHSHSELNFINCVTTSTLKWYTSKWSSLKLLVSPIATSWSPTSRPASFAQSISFYLFSVACSPF